MNSHVTVVYRNQDLSSNVATGERTPVSNSIDSSEKRYVPFSHVLFRADLKAASKRVKN
jgi:hypothetical protein